MLKQAKREKKKRKEDRKIERYKERKSKRERQGEDSLARILARNFTALTTVDLLASNHRWDHKRTGGSTFDAE